MSDQQDIQEISEITTEKGVLGTRYVVEVDGKKKKFREVEEAADYRKEQLELQEQQQFIREVEQEAAARDAAEAEAKAKARAEYDRDPDYLAIVIHPPLDDVREPRAGIFSRSDQGGATVDAEAYAREVNDACFDLSRRGYEVVSITPLISGHAGFQQDVSRWKDRSAGWGAGWGYSYTDGMVLLARKAKQTAGDELTALPGPDDGASA